MDIGGRWRKLAVDTALLTGSSIVMRCIAMVFQVWLVGRIGAAGIGLYQLVASVNMLCVTFAISGIRFTTTRLISEEIGSESWGSISCAVGRCIAYALFFGSSAFLILYLCAEPIGFLWIGDARTVLSLRIVSFRMPFIAVSSVLNGYFIASGRAYKSAAVQLLEQLSSIGLVVLFLTQSPPHDLELACAAVSLGSSAADVISFILIASLYFLDRRKHGCPGTRSKKLTSRLFRIAVPLALSAYARTSLTTLENLLVPRKLKASGLSADSALSGYGTITGMVFPIISFPTCILSALAELVIPDLTEAQVSGDTDYIERTVSALLRAAVIFSCASAIFIWSTADALGYLIYGTDDVGSCIRIFALIIPFMYIDIVTDGCLKGLGQMMYSMCYNISEAFIGVVLVIGILPRWALKGYIFVLFFCEIYNFTLSICRLRHVTRFSIFLQRKDRSSLSANTAGQS